MSVGTTLIAGCSADTETGVSTEIITDTDSSTGTTSTPMETPTDIGTFRLMISDQPVAIDDFDELTVSFERARVFRAASEDDGQGGPLQSTMATDTEAATNTAVTTADSISEVNSTTATNETATTSEPEDRDTESTNSNHEGFSTFDLGGVSVDLTQVIGAKAIDVFGAGLTEGRYSKIELYAASVHGIVSGEAVDVTIPSGKLQITKPFDVVKGETVRFVFDITVVKKGRNDEYNLLPVISESGVAGQDIDVEEVTPKPSSPSTIDDPETEVNNTRRRGPETDRTENGSKTGKRGGPPHEDNSSS